ncbi:uncharacterized protein STAUR_1845 [Stigmatella aurantiaca DW4/3-1]|uniref:Uncharacterized protein n=1 Tax=Stigmatella aurantiaca (strain DW4/3-1) TaxID=378806 RepID=E3FTN5_STIAD|nr:uncharacterized protein STAUR_1845 [Stigmatella aurantiaca DW4/3-1]
MTHASLARVKEKKSHEEAHAVSLFLVLVSPIANAQTFVWLQTGSGMSHTTVNTYAVNAAAFSQLNAANPGTGDDVWAANLRGHRQCRYGCHRRQFRMWPQSTPALLLRL